MPHKIPHKPFQILLVDDSPTAALMPKAGYTVVRLP
jgi:hypothetical protein